MTGDIRASKPAAPPIRLSIASIDITANVVPVRVRAGALDIPENPRMLGWWSSGASAGSRSGSVVVVGHVDSARYGRGALFRLASVPMGARVSVETAHGTVSYEVVGRRVYAKQALPRTVFATTGEPRLVLITCGGPFNATTRHYADNVVVFAVPAK